MFNDLKNSTKVLIVAAGKGTRSGLNFPKTLFKIQGKTILQRILENSNSIDSYQVVIASSSGKQKIQKHLKEINSSSEVLVQEKQIGMGDAVLKFQDSQYFKNTKNVLLIWGDIPFVNSDKLTKLINFHLENKNDFSLISHICKNPYTKIIRDQNNKILKVNETHNHESNDEISNERDIGVFIFNKELIFDYLARDFLNKHNSVSGEHGFLYIIEHLIKDGHRVEAYPIASDAEAVSLNQISDIQDYL